MSAISCIVTELAPRGLKEEHCPRPPGTAHRSGLSVPQETLEVPLHEKFHFSLEGTNWNAEADG